MQKIDLLERKISPFQEEDGELDKDNETTTEGDGFTEDGDFDKEDGDIESGEFEEEDELEEEEN